MSCSVVCSQRRRDLFPRAPRLTPLTRTAFKRANLISRNKTCLWRLKKIFISVNEKVCNKELPWRNECASFSNARPSFEIFSNKLSCIGFSLKARAKFDGKNGSILQLKNSSVRLLTRGTHFWRSVYTYSTRNEFSTVSLTYFFCRFFPHFSCSAK